MGNMTSYGNVAYTWDGKQLVDICLLPIEVHISYSYNEDGLRVGKRVSWSSLGVERNTEYYYNGSVLIGMKTGDTVQRFSYDAQGKVVSVDYSENGGSTYTTYYYIRNAQGDIVKLIDGSGSTVVEYTYDSWGKILSVTGTLESTLGEDQPFRYRGYVYDSDTRLYYLQSRYYNPEVGRFISSDVYLSTGQGVLGHNSYAYCLNNPLILEDQGGAAAHFNNTVAVCDCGTSEDKDWMSERTELERGLRNYGVSTSKEKTSIFQYISNLTKSIIKSLGITNDANEVIERAESGKWFSIYKGTLVKHTDWGLFPSSLCPGPCIILNESQRSAANLNHEYGHSVQFRLLGPSYLTKIVIPSLAGFGLSELCPGFNSYYYRSQPWEVTADMFGGVDQLHIPYSEGIGMLYLLMP